MGREVAQWGSRLASFAHGPWDFYTILTGCQVRNLLPVPPPLSTQTGYNLSLSPIDVLNDIATRT